MALVTCYDPQGVEHQKEPVDARECVKHCGFTLTPPQVKSASGTAAPEASVAATAPETKAGKSGQK
jgi:hypothetical protein